MKQEITDRWNFVEDLITNYGYKSYEEIGYTNKLELAAHMIKCADYKKGENLEFLVESDNAQSFVQYLTDSWSSNFGHSNRKELLEDAINCLEKNTIRYYESFMIELFDRVLGEVTWKGSRHGNTESPENYADIRGQ